MTESHVCVPCNPFPRQNSRRGRRQFPSGFPLPRNQQVFRFIGVSTATAAGEYRISTYSVIVFNRVGSNSWQHFIAAAAKKKKLTK